MDIPIDVEVLCTDGPGGHSSAIVLNPVTKEVTHFAVRTKGFLSDEYLVPVDTHRREHARAHLALVQPCGAGPMPTVRKDGSRRG